MRRHVERNAHEHTEGQLCELCLSRLVLSGNPILDAINELSFVSGQLLILILQGAGKLIASAPATVAMFIRSILIRLGLCERLPGGDHVHQPGQQVCERCLGSFSSSGRLVDTLRESLYIAGQAILFVAHLVGIAIMGLAMCIVTIFPSSVRASTPHEREMERRFRERRLREWMERQREIEEQNEFDEKWRTKRTEEFERHDEEMREYNKNVERLNGPEGKELLIVGNEVLVDDLMVRDINNTLKGVETGVEDPEKLRKMSEELIAKREKKAKKDARRRELDIRSEDEYRQYQRKYAEAENESDPRKQASLYYEAEEHRLQSRSFHYQSLGV